MTPRERELLQGMCKCYSVCGADFEGTVSMVAGARGLDTQEAKKTLRAMKKKYRNDPEYGELRRRLPEDFPI